MKYQELTTKTTSELYDSLCVLKKELLGLRIQKSMGQLANTAQIRKGRRSIARIMTRLGQQKVSRGS